MAVEKRVKNWGAGQDGANLLLLALTWMLMFLNSWRRSQLMEWHPGSLSWLQPAGELWGSEKLLVFASPRFFSSELPNNLLRLVLSNPGVDMRLQRQNESLDF